MTIKWTAEMDATILLMRTQQKAAWGLIGRKLGFAEMTVLNRGRKLGIEAKRSLPASCIDWTDAMDSTLRRMRVEESASWLKVAAALGISSGAAMNRGCVLGISVRLKPPAPVAEPVHAGPRNYQEPMRAGDLVSWTIITAGTSLEGTAYEPHLHGKSRAAPHDHEAA